MRKLILSGLIYLFTLLWLGLFLWFGVATLIYAPEQVIKDKEFINKEIDPSIKRINNFKAINHRLPTVAEFSKLNGRDTNDLGNTDYIRNDRNLERKIKNRTKGMDWNKNYVLFVWRGEWAEYYISDGHQYVTNDYQISDAVILMVVAIFIGVLPLSTVILFKRSRYRRDEKIRS